MKSPLTKAVVYKAYLPAADILEAGLMNFPFDQVPAHRAQASGFVENPVTGKVLTTLNGVGYAFVLRTDRRVVPASSVARALDEKVAEIEETQARKVFKKERSVLKDEILLDLYDRALLRTELTYAFYNHNSNLLFVAAGSSGAADNVMGALIHALGHLRTATIHVSEIKEGLSTRMQKWLQEDDMEAFGGLEPDDYCRLVRNVEGEGKEVVTHAGVYLQGMAGEIAGLIKEGFKIDQVGFVGEGPIYFKLTDQFRFKSILVPPPEVDEGDEDDFEPWARWCQESGVRVALLTAVVNKLCEMFQYKEPEGLAEEPVCETCDGLGYVGAPSISIPDWRCDPGCQPCPDCEPEEDALI